MKTNYKIRARKFIAQFVKYAGKCDWTNVTQIEDIVDDFCRDFHRKIFCSCGAARCCLVTSDYAIKWDYDYDCAEEIGGCFSECAKYQKAIKDGYEYLLAESTLIEYNGHYFEIMPRVDGIGRGSYYGYYVDRKERAWIDDNISDLHSGNYAICNGKLIITDYACGMSSDYSNSTSF